MVIVVNIIPRNVIINRGALDPLFSTVLGLPWWGEIQRENNAQPLIDLHEWKYFFHKNVSFEQFECSNWSWRSVQQITS